MASENNKQVPVLWNHDPKNPIGKVEFVDDKIVLTINGDTLISDEMFFNAFGGAGIRVLDSVLVDGVSWIRKCEILEFSFP